MIKTSSFKSAWWLPGPHLQTLWPVLSWAKRKPTTIRQRLELADGDFIDLDWVNQNLNTPIIVILHGLEGSASSHYVRDMLYTLQQLNYRAVLMHFRGCSGEMNRTARYYHSGDTADLHCVIEMLRQHYPEKPLGAIGYSLGGNVLLKWLGETGVNNPLRCAIAISVPMLLNKSVDRMQRGFSRVYQWYLIKQLRQKLLQKQSRMVLPIEVDIEKIRDFWSFDDKVTAPLHGFKSAEDYYTKASSRQYLKSIAVPTLIIHAKDDPFTDASIIPPDDELSPFVTLELSVTGGHVGFIAGVIPGRGKSWLLQRVPTFIQEKFMESID
jgi:predicted alpha/beta-fold hydrolase